MTNVKNYEMLSMITGSISDKLCVVKIANLDDPTYGNLRLVPPDHSHSSTILNSKLNREIPKTNIMNKRMEAIPFRISRVLLYYTYKFAMNLQRVIVILNGDPYFFIHK